MPGSERFPKRVRLRKRRQFLAVQDRGHKLGAEHLVGLWLRSDQGEPRLGLTVSSKVGNAVIRNRIRRQLRELFRKRQHALPRGVDLVLIARSTAAKADFAALARSFDEVTRRLAAAVAR